MIYLDYAANTPVDDKVLKTYVDITKRYSANPNSSHTMGLNAKKKIDSASEIITRYFNCDKSSVIYTSGSSESNNLVIKGICEYNGDKGKHIIISSVEHSSIVAPCNYLVSKGYEVTVIPITKDGTIDLDVLKNSIRNDTILVSIASVDSELGVVQPIKEISDIVKTYPNIVFHTDATQAIGKIDMDYSCADFITFAPHKFYGLNGMGVLINRNNKKLVPLIHGGKSTSIYRSGTPVVANAVTTSTALELAIDNLNDRYRYISGLKGYLLEELSKYNFVHINSPENSIPNTLNFSLIKMKASNFIDKLEKKNIYLSTVSACSMKNSASKSVYAITNDYEMASNSIRISLSHLTKLEELKTFISEFDKIYREEVNDEDNKN
ncbi:MAG: cysteine desulfurase family protein [Bacilli bacterium]